MSNLKLIEFTAINLNCETYKSTEPDDYIVYSLEFFKNAGCFDVHANICLATGNDLTGELYTAQMEFLYALNTNDTGEDLLNHLCDIVEHAYHFLTKRIDKSTFKKEILIRPFNRQNVRSVIIDRYPDPFQNIAL